MALPRALETYLAHPDHGLGSALKKGRIRQLPGNLEGAGVGPGGLASRLGNPGGGVYQPAEKAFDGCSVVVAKGFV